MIGGCESVSWEISGLVRREFGASFDSLESWISHVFTDDLVILKLLGTFLQNFTAILMCRCTETLQSGPDILSFNSDCVCIKPFWISEFHTSKIKIKNY
jgi:hypothetical protein